MPNQVEFLVLIPALAAVDFALDTTNFFAQFVAAPMPAGGFAPLPNLATAAGKAMLRSAALDAGYGTNLMPIPGFLAAEVVLMQPQFEAQQSLVESLFAQNPAGQTVVLPVMRQLEKNGKSSNGYALGMLYSRVVTELWAQANGLGAIQRFWHYGVLAQPMVNLVPVSLHNSYNPDFVVQHGNNDWVCLEAKGTLDDIDLARMKKGLYQAYKLAQIQWQPPAGALQFAIPSQVCTMAYFDAANNDTLEVRHLDPPATQSTLDLPERKRPLLFLEAGDFYLWGQAILQFEVMEASQAPDGLPNGEMDWARWPVTTNTWVAIPSLLRDHRETLEWVSELLNWLTPTLGRWRSKSLLDRDIGEDLRRIPGRLQRMAKHARRRARIENQRQRVGTEQAWLLLANTLRDLSRDEVPPSWSTTLSKVWDARILDPLGPEDRRRINTVSSLSQLWYTLRGIQRSAPENWYLTALLPADGNPPEAIFQSKATVHGLLVVVTDPPKPPTPNLLV